MPTRAVICLNQVMHTTWCKDRDSFEMHADGAECTEIRTLDLDGAFVSVRAQGIPFDSQAVEVLDCLITTQAHTKAVTEWLSRTLTEMSEMVEISEAWESVMVEHHSDAIDRLQGMI